jgi:hypothetical protein
MEGLNPPDKFTIEDIIARPEHANNIISPAHYKNGPWEAIEVIEAVVEAVSKDGGSKMAYNIGAALKYLLRAGRKGDVKEQIQKAQWHISRALIS